MKLLLSLCFFGLVAAAPAPQEDEMIEALPYVHDEPLESHDIAAEAYAHNEIEAEPYVQEDIAAEAYVHEDIAPAPAVYAAVAPVAYAGYPYTVALAPSAPAKDVKVASYAVAAPYAVAAVKTGCINSVGSVVPCAV